MKTPTQSKIDSALEALTNIFVGFSINFTANILIFPIFGWEISISQNLLLGGCYTMISYIRSYALRRAFDGRSVYQAIKSKLGDSA
ncbi:DUF7220 family protein [Paraglaciecola psychrophila]|uniref:Uncharacterized protein n=1 Tax=Paraglaciecola psychrophila 170 TaxID=1129794 RepID=K7A389_9ALTE|nr:hypothetical protein [Paraglaciecola psychrophila]AGH44507.1 hypothetical protein C427_2398 [Paraglaciecola psychrophila 170]GAC36817.1 hypothetical protein GPSY_1180 [Paraglaciecola psychrophila 170]